MILRPVACLGFAALLQSPFAQAQTPPEPAANTPQRVEVTGGRQGDTEQRRQSTAAKIVVGREEIERFGDSTLGEVLKRLPGVTLSGAPGRGGGIRMRGLGAGYTQILLDGQRVPPGFSLDSINPDQIERIEILRAPTAETGARAIAGTINIVTREGFTKRMNDLRVGAQWQRDRLSPGFSWTRNGGEGPFNFNVSLSGFHQSDLFTSATTTTDSDASGAAVLQQREQARTQSWRDGLHLTSRLQWTLNEQGDNLMLMPFLVHSQGRSDRDAQLATLLGSPTPGNNDWDHAHTDGDSRFTLARLNGQARQRLEGGARLEWHFGTGLADSRSHSLRNEFDDGGTLLRTLDEPLHTRETSATLALKASKLLDGDHSLVSGAEWEGAHRTEEASAEGASSGEGDNLRARTQRVALYMQDEWNINPHWAAHAGLRWEGINTRGSSSADNRSSVFTPLLHAVWKPDPKGRDQVRFSLTRSYKSPTLSNLIARRQTSLNNAPTRPDRMGNPALKPELATGLDVALERYLAEGGVLSANVFHRRIRDLIRTELLQEPDGRWLARPGNVGSATTQGLELEAKFRLSALMKEAPPIDLRTNASVFRSKVDSVPGPDNRLDQQPRGTANVGADWRLRGTPLTLGGNLNLTPGYATRESAIQSLVQSRKRVFDAYALWLFNPALQLRLTGSNLAPRDHETVNTVAMETADTVNDGHPSWRLQLEMKL